MYNKMHISNKDQEVSEATKVVLENGKFQDKNTYFSMFMST